MAEYEHYSKTSSTYDVYRRPVGLESLNRSLELASENLALPIDELRVLDVGCGTGNYISELNGRVKSCTGIDQNKGMLAKALEKHQHDPRVVIREGTVLSMDCFDDGSFDVVIMTHVIHHLTPDTQPQALKEISRVLKTGGAFWLNTSTQLQCLVGIWWAELVPQAMAAVGVRLPGMAMLESLLIEAGFQPKTLDVIPETLMKDSVDLEGPFKAEYRNADSTWSLATPEELSAGLRWLRRKIDNGTATAWLEERENLRKMFGQTTSITSVKAV